MKYICEIVKETQKEFNQDYESYYNSLLNTIIDYKEKGCKLHIGTKHIKVYDSQNKLEMYSETPPDIKGFKNYCLNKGYKFIKK